MQERYEICDTIDSLRLELEGLVIRGLRTAGPNELKTLDGIHTELSRVGAEYLAAQVGALNAAVKSDDKHAPTHLMRVQTGLHVFERVLTQDTVCSLLAHAITHLGQEPLKDEVVPKAAPAAPKLDERKKLPPLLEDLTRAVEELAATGLTTASEATRQKLDFSFKEASRLKLLRLGTVLRYINEEFERFLKDDSHFDSKRLAFFLNRAWLLSRGMNEALAKKDEQALATLLLTSTQVPVPVPTLELAVLGVSKRVVKNSCSFDFRMRVLEPVAGIKVGQPLSWGCLFAHKPEVPAEAYLHLPQPQKFNPKLFLENCRIKITDCAVLLDEEHGGGRLMLGPKSTVTQGDPFTDWEQFAEWDLRSVHLRLAQHKPSPLDLPTDYREEVVLKEWEIGEPIERYRRPDQKVFPMKTPYGLEFDAVVSTGADGEDLIRCLKVLRKSKKRPPIFGLLHYELCRLVFMPLALFEDKTMKQMMISDKKINLSALLSTLNIR